MQDASGSKRPSSQTELSNVKRQKLSTTVDNGSGDTSVNGGRGNSPPADPEKLSDALLAAGVNLKEEEQLLSSSIHIDDAKGDLRFKRKPITGRPEDPEGITMPFLDPRVLFPFVNRIIERHGMKRLQKQNPEILLLLSVCCENWFQGVIDGTLTLARHRRRTQQTGNSGARSEVSKALRALAIKEKEDEEKRVQRRIALGIDSTVTGVNRTGLEDTLHRATNETAAMMTSARKYSWMTSATTPTKKVSGIIAPRGDNGTRFREPKEEKSVTMRDLLGVLETRRFGAEKTLIKGYAKLRD